MKFVKENSFKWICTKEIILGFREIFIGRFDAIDLAYSRTLHVIREMAKLSSTTQGFFSRQKWKNETNENLVTEDRITITKTLQLPLTNKVQALNLYSWSFIMSWHYIILQNHLDQTLVICVEWLSETFILLLS